MTEFKIGVINPVECFKEGWELIKDQYWLMFGITLVGMMLGGFSMYILLGAMMCGIYRCYLQKIDGNPANFDDLWVGFQKIVPSLVLTLFLIVPAIFLYFLIYVPFIIAGIMGSKLSSNELTGLIAGALIFDFILIVLMTCFHTLLIFSFPLIIDRNLGAWESVTTSAKAVWRNLSGIAGMVGVLFVVSIVATILTCGLGVYFLMPIMFAGYAVAYRKVFPAFRNDNFNPPPPSAFQNAGGYNQ